jgi:hypothetical protein
VIAEWSAAALAGAGSDRGTPTRLTGTGREPSASSAGRFPPKSELQPHHETPQPMTTMTIDG